MKRLLFFALALSTTAVAQDISGTYYVGEPNYDASLEHPWKRNFEKVDITFDMDKQLFELVYDPAQRPMKASPTPSTYEDMKKGLVYSFDMSNVGPNCLANATLLQIEPGVFVVDPATSLDLGCTTVKRPTKSNAPAKGGRVYPVEPLVREFILGKDKNRVAELVANHTLYEQILAEAVMKRCKSISNTSAAKNPVPAKGSLDASEGKVANELIQQWAIQKNWPQQVKSSFVKSNDWEIVKNAKGAILHRSITCVVIMDQNGSCSWKEFYVHQAYNGSGYGKSYVYGEGQGQYATDCR